MLQTARNFNYAMLPNNKEKLHIWQYKSDKIKKVKFVAVPTIKDNK